MDKSRPRRPVAALPTFGRFRPGLESLDERNAASTLLWNDLYGPDPATARTQGDYRPAEDDSNFSEADALALNSVPAGPPGVNVEESGKPTQEGKTEIDPRATKIGGPGRITYPKGSVVVVSANTPTDVADSKKVAPPGTPVISGARTWEDVRNAINAQPAGSITALVLSGHGSINGGLGRPSEQVYLDVQRLVEDPVTIKAIKSQLAPGAPIIISACDQGGREYADQMQRLADVTGHPVIVNTGATQDGNYGQGDWVRYDPKSK